MSRKRNYSPQIDALRAIAIVVVMLHHYIIGPFLLAGFGVVMFFLLSGYFGTQALLRLRVKLENRSISPWQALVTFYQRRYSRILPLHYLVLGCAAIAGVAYARPSLFWNVCFISNYRMLYAQEWDGRFSQLWSLSVLEQFYLVWPLVILFLPRRSLLPMCLAGVAVAIGWRVVCTVQFLSPMAWTLAPFSGYDQLCIGALLSLCTLERRPVARRWLLRVSGASGLLFLAMMAGRAFGFDAPHSAVYIPLVASLGFAWVVNGAREGFSGWIGRALSSPLLCHCGRISFGAFLLHNMTELMIPHSPHMRHLLASNYRFVVLVPATFIFADIAWRFYEAPMLHLRESGLLLRRMWSDRHIIGEAFWAPIRNCREGIAIALLMTTRHVPLFLALAIPEQVLEASGWLGSSTLAFNYSKGAKYHHHPISWTNTAPSSQNGSAVGKSVAGLSSLTFTRISNPDPNQAGSNS